MGGNSGFLPRPRIDSARRWIGSLPRDRVVGAIVILIALVVFLLSPVFNLSDNKYTFLLSETIYKQGKCSFNRIKDLPADYRLHHRGSNIFYGFPPGSSALSIPFVAMVNVCGFSVITPEGSYDVDCEVMMQRILAALLMAALAGVVYALARFQMPRSWGVFIALGTAFGTQVWSTASRAMWSDTWGIFLMTCVVWMLSAGLCARREISPWQLASLLAWSYIVRPTNAIPIVCVMAFLALHDWRKAVWTSLVGGGWLVAFIAYSERHYGQLLPPYFSAARLNFLHFGEALAGNLVSPQRGVLMYVPVLVFIGYLVIRYRRSLPHPRLVVLSAAICGLHFISISGYPHWYGGHSYGPRLMTGLVPWFVLLAVEGLQAWRAARLRLAEPRWIHRLPAAECCCGMALLSVCCVMHGIGATSRKANTWSCDPVSVDDYPERMWDWGQPQFLAAFQKPRMKSEYPVLDRLGRAGNPGVQARVNH